MHRAGLVAVSVLALALGGMPAQAQDPYPSKPIKALIPFAAGSATDIVPRMVFDPLVVELGQPVVVENRGGAGGTLGVGTVVKANPDGYTILANSSAHTAMPWLVPNLPYDIAHDLAGVAMLGQNAVMLVVSPDRGWKSVQDLVAAAKANPGTISYGSAGVGTGTHLSAEKFRLRAGFDAVHVPYKGGAEALTDVIGGRIDFYFCPVATAIPYVREKLVVALAASTPERPSAFPDVPTLGEAGYPNASYQAWFGVFMPAKTPRPVIDIFHAAVNKALAVTDLRRKFGALGIDPMPMTPAEIDRYIVDEIAANGEIVRTAGIR